MDFSKQKPAPFNPRARSHRRKLWVRVANHGNAYYHVYWQRLGAMLTGLALAGWLGLAGAAWVFVKYRRGYQGVSYGDLAFYPFRREQYRVKIGRHFIESGRAAVEKQHFREGYALLLAGLSRLPQDVEARRSVAILEARLGRFDRALQTLRAGVTFARDDLDYLKQLFGLLLEAQEDEQVIALAHELLPAGSSQTRLNQFVALQAATAHFHRGRTAAVERLLGEWNLERSLEGQILLARCEWENGHRAAALARLEVQRPNFPRRDELFIELIRFHRELGHRDETRRYALLRQFNDPAGAGPRIDLLHTYRVSGDRAAEERELEDYVQRFRADERALLLLAWFALDTVQPALAERVQAMAREKNFLLAPFTVVRVEVALAARDHAQALALADDALKTEAGGAPGNAILLHALRAVALFALGDTSRGQVILSAFLEEGSVRASDALLLARHFKALGQFLPARRVLERACQLDPLNQPALAELIRLDAELGDRAALAENLPKLLGMRRPSRIPLEETLRHLNEPADAPLRAQIQAALARPTPD